MSKFSTNRKVSNTNIASIYDLLIGLDPVCFINFLFKMSAVVVAKLAKSASDNAKQGFESRYWQLLMDICWLYN